MEVPDIGMKTIGFDNCRKLLGDDGDTNSMLAMILYHVSQLYPRTKEQEKSSRVI